MQAAHCVDEDAVAVPAVQLNVAHAPTLPAGVYVPPGHGAHPEPLLPSMSDVPLAQRKFPQPPTDPAGTYEPYVVLEQLTHGVDGL